MDKEKLLDLYKQMLSLRHFDEMCWDLKMQDLIMDGFHPYSGEEACGVGASTELQPSDYVVSTHRPQAHSICKGSTTKEIFCEMLGRRGGPSEGIGGPMQWIDTDNHFFCGSIVGSGLTIATGIAMTLKKEGKGRVCLCYFGDGSSNTGSFHEAMNLAAIWKLPVVFVLENNQYAEAMPVREFVSAYPISNRAIAYGLEGVTIDGNDVELVSETVGKAIKEARKGVGPHFIELETYRFRGHYGGDPEQTYRTREEVEAKKEFCPLKRCKKRLIGLGLSEQELDNLDQEVYKEIEADRDWALEQRFPTFDEAVSNVLIPLQGEK